MDHAGSESLSVVPLDCLLLPSSAHLPPCVHVCLCVCMHMVCNMVPRGVKQKSRIEEVLQVTLILLIKIKNNHNYLLSIQQLCINIWF